jgi:hypothetical protein
MLKKTPGICHLFHLPTPHSWHVSKALELLIRDRHRQWSSQPDCIGRTFLHTEIAVKAHFWMGYNRCLSFNFAKTFGAKEYILSAEVGTFTTIDTLLIIYFWWHNLTPQFVKY